MDFGQFVPANERFLTDPVLERGGAGRRILCDDGALDGWAGAPDFPRVEMPGFMPRGTAERANSESLDRDQMDRSKMHRLSIRSGQPKAATKVKERSATAGDRLAGFGKSYHALSILVPQFERNTLQTFANPKGS